MTIIEPLAVSPREAARLLGIRERRIYQLMSCGELANYRDGRARKILMESIRARVARLAAADKTWQPVKAPPPPNKRKAVLTAAE
jgi:excisionase family DNA binding protein